MQKHVFDKAASGGAGEGAATGGGESNGMTRVAGASLAAVSAYTMHAGLHGSAKERSLAYKVTAGQSAVGAGVLFHSKDFSRACMCHEFWDVDLCVCTSHKNVCIVTGECTIWSRDGKRNSFGSSDNLDSRLFTLQL